MDTGLVVRAAIAAWVVLMLAACGGGGSAGGEAGDFMEDVYTARASGDYGMYYDKLHPSQQALVSRNTFVSCLNRSKRSGTTLKQVKILDTYDSDLEQQGIPQRQAEVVVVRVETERAGKTANDIQVAYAVKVDDGYRWLLGPDAASTLAEGDCPSGA